jgi:transposase-like protein
MGPVRHGRPLPLHPVGSVEVNHAVDLLETEEGGVVFLYGMAAWCFEPGDVVGRRLAAVQLVETGSATPTQVASAFDVDFETLRRWRRDWAAEGPTGLVPRKRGPKGPNKVTEEVRARIVELRASGMNKAAVARQVGLDPTTVAAVLDKAAAPPPAPSQAGGLEPLARPAPRTDERELARSGLLAGAEPLVCEGSSLPLAGALLVLPALCATGLLEAFSEVYEMGRAAFYSLRALVLTLAFCLLVGAARAEGLVRLDPVDLGRLIGLDRAPEVKTLRRRMEELAVLERSDDLFRRLAAAHLGRAGEAAGVFYVDGHVRAYHGEARLQKAHLARARLAAPAEVDTWVVDRRGDGVLCWTAEPGAALSGELLRATAEIRALLGPDARPTVAFDRGGYSPRLFAELVAAGFHVLTYRKKPVKDEPRSAFLLYKFTDDLGRKKSYLLADRRVRLSYADERRARHYFSCRQVTRLDEQSGHQTQVLTTRGDLASYEVADAMFSRWREENFFRYLRANYGLDALDSYAKIPDDPTRTVPNPKKKAAARRVAEARTAIATAQAHEGRAALAGGGTSSEVVAAFAAAEAELAERVQAARSLPARVPLGDLHPDAMRLAGERKRLHDVVRMAVYNATSATARLLAPHYRRAEDEGRTLLDEAFRSPADLEVIGDELHVRLAPLSAPRRSRAIAGLCEELNASETLYPGTKLRLVYRLNDA